MKKKIYCTLTGVLMLSWMLVIFWFSHQPAVRSSRMSGGICDQLVAMVDQTLELHLTEQEISEIAEEIEYPVRKAAHMAEYAILGLLSFAFYRGILQKRRKIYLASLLTVIIYAATDEIHQLFVVGRAGRISDVLIDTAGAVVGLFFLYIIGKIFRKHCEKKQLHVQ